MGTFKTLSILLVFCTLELANAAIKIPSGLKQKDREQTARILGWGTAGKILSDPYPLGGYSGLELGLSIESVPVDDLGRLGRQDTGPQDSFTYPKLSIGKGLYSNVDSWIHFIPFNESTGFSEYGGIFRWCFYQAAFFPGTISAVIHGNASNIANTFSGQTSGADLISGINIGNIGLYLGGGKIYSTGRFLGGSRGVTDTNKDETVTVEGFHSLIGGAIRLQNLFAAFQLDLYTQPIFSSKIGMRF